MCWNSLNPVSIWEINWFLQVITRRVVVFFGNYSEWENFKSRRDPRTSNSFCKTPDMVINWFLVYVFIRIPVKHYRMVGCFILPVSLFAINLGYIEWTCYFNMTKMQYNDVLNLGFNFSCQHSKISIHKKNFLISNLLFEVNVSVKIKAPSKDMYKC